MTDRKIDDGLATLRASSPNVLSGVPGGKDLKLHHVRIVVNSIERSSGRYCRLFGLQRVTPVVTDERQRVNVQFLASEAGATSLELIEPLPGSSPARGALEKGGGLNHLCFEVEDIATFVQQAESEGAVCVCPPVPAIAFSGRRIAFLYYREIGLIEFLEAAKK